MPGPVPKLKAERRHRGPVAAGDPRILDVNDLPDEGLPFKIKQDVEVPDPTSREDFGTGWHPIAAGLWDSFERSGAALFWEPSDWAVARLLCESLSRDLGEQVVGVSVKGDAVYSEIPLKGASLSAYSKVANQLMLTEADRRRAGLEIKRDRLKRSEPAAVVDLGDRRRELLGE